MKDQQRTKAKKREGRGSDEPVAFTIYQRLPGEDKESLQKRIFHNLLYELELAKDAFGYEAVYFGVGCEAFPDAVNPWPEHGQH